MRPNFDKRQKINHDEAVATITSTGRTNQKQRTRTAIVEAARALIEAGGEVTMPLVAQTALVSEATAYRYFPDLVSLLGEAFTQLWRTPEQVMQPVEGMFDPVARVVHATTVLLTEVAAYQGAVRVMVSAAITRPDGSLRPGRRLALIELALQPPEQKPGRVNRSALRQLKLDLAVVISAEAFFTLVDLCGLSPAQAIISATHAAEVIVKEAAPRVWTGPRQQNATSDGLAAIATGYVPALL
jgi:AcrR family transcriptional regulator